MRVVLDTNVLISGIYFGGIPGRIVDAWLDVKFTACITPSIYEEYLKVIDRFSKKGTSPIVERDWPTLLPEICYMISDQRLSQPISRDPGDDKFIACAVGAKASHIVTGDLDLKTIPPRLDFKIVSPEEFLNILK